jgi:hypothetical protein
MKATETTGQQRELEPVLGHYKEVPPIDPRLARKVWVQWEPDRPELLVRLRPRRTAYAAW